MSLRSALSDRRRRRRLLPLLSALCAAQFLSSACVSVLAPFFPAEAASRGATAAETGAVFASFELVAMLASPAAGAAIGTVVSARLASQTRVPNQPFGVAKSSTTPI